MSWATVLAVLHYSIALALAVRVMLKPGMAASVRLAWILVIEIVPVVGILAWVLFGEVRMRRVDRQRAADVRQAIAERWVQSPHIVRDLPEPAAAVVAQAATTGGLLATRGNRLRLLPEDDGAMEEVARAIDAARHSVDVLFYIWLDDVSGRRIARACADAARRGVVVRVIADALGSRRFLRSRTWADMLAAGAEGVQAFPLGNPVARALTSRLDLRNHRKIVVVDGRLGFTGSRNCSDMAFTLKPKYAPWVDVLIAVEGPAVRQLEVVFVQDWLTASTHPLSHEALTRGRGARGDGPVAGAGDARLAGQAVGQAPAPARSAPHSTGSGAPPGLVSAPPVAGSSPAVPASGSDGIAGPSAESDSAPPTAASGQAAGSTSATPVMASGPFAGPSAGSGMAAGSSADPDPPPASRESGPASGAAPANPEAGLVPAPAAAVSGASAGTASAAPITGGSGRSIGSGRNADTALEAGPASGLAPATLAADPVPAIGPAAGMPWGRIDTPSPDLRARAETIAPLLPPIDAVAEPGQIVQVVPIGPDFRPGTLSDVLATLIYAARRRLIITTPYYVPDEATDAAICAAARRGVDVTMILPARNDSPLVQAVSEGFYGGLLRAGVRIALFQGGLCHSKIVSVDGDLALVGTANLDRRSFDLNYEVSLLVVDRDFVADLDARQADYLRRSRLLTLDEVRARPYLWRMTGNLASLAAPLL